jgi:hypothetical protein
VHIAGESGHGEQGGEAYADGTSDDRQYVDAGTDRAGVYLVKATTGRYTTVGKVVISP